MAKNGIQTGDILTLDPGATVSSGDIIPVGSAPNVIMGIALSDGVSGTDIAVGVRGVYNIAKTTSQAWAVGQSVYFVASTSKGSTAADGNALLGTCVEAAGSSATSGKILLAYPASTGAPRVLFSGQLAFTAATTGTESVGAAFDGKVVRAFLQTNDGTAALVKGAIASGTLTLTASASMTGKAYYEILDVDVA